MHLRTREEQETAVDRLAPLHDPQQVARLYEQARDPDRYQVKVSLAAELADGRLVGRPNPCLRISAPVTGPGAITHRYRSPPCPPLPDDAQQRDAVLARYRVGPQDIEDSIDQLLGRHPEMHRPPRLAWDNLITDLAAVGVQVGEAELIAAPLTVHFQPSVRALFDGDSRASP